MPDINPFSTPNIIYTEYTGHGGGNVNEDLEDRIDWDDYNAMDTMPSHISDIDGDGFFSTDNDKKILAEYLNGERGYLPGHWNWLQTREERNEWANKIVNTYKVNHRIWDDNSNSLLKYVSGNYKTDICVGLVGQTLEGVDYYGNPKIPIFDKYSNKENNGKGNLPMFGVQRIRNYVGHGMNAILVGDNPLEFDDWLFYEPQTNKFVDPRKDETSGEFVDNEIRIEMFDNLLDVGDGVNETQMTGTPTAVVFHSEKETGNIGYIEQNQNLILNRPTVAIEDEKRSNPSSYSLGQNFPNPFNPTTTIPYSLDKQADISLDLYDITGKLVRNLEKGVKHQGSYTENLNASNLPSGQYILNLRTEDGWSESKKILLTK